MHRALILAVVALFLSATATNSTAALIVYVADLDGASEFPPNTSPGVGFARVGFDPVAHILDVYVEFSGLIGSTTAAHIHGPTAEPLDISLVAGVATMLPSFSGFPLGVTSGTYSMVFDTTDPSTYNPAFITNFGGGTVAGAEAALGAMLADGKAYFNIHTNEFPGGEIRGFLQPQPIPEPASLVLWGLGLLAVTGFARSRRSVRRAEGTPPWYRQNRPPEG